MPDREALERRTKWGEAVHRGLIGYVCLQYLPVAMGTTALLWFKDDMSKWDALLPAVLLIWTTVSWGALFEGKQWALPFEWTRLLVLLPSAFLVVNAPVWFLPAVIALVCTSLLWLVLAPRRGWLVETSLS